MKIILPPFSEVDMNDSSCLDLYLFRHGYTRYNLEKRYQGKTDLPLLEEESERIRPYSFSKDHTEPALEQNGVQIQNIRKTLDLADDLPDVVYVSGALRTLQTAELLFPGMRQIVIPEFWEMDFGVFEGRSAEEMKSDSQYRSWVDSMCEAPAPDGESRTQFTKRVTDRFSRLAEQALLEGRKKLLIVAHGGTQMAIMEHFCEKNQPYWSWQSAPREAIHAMIRF